MQFASYKHASTGSASEANSRRRRFVQNNAPSLSTWGGLSCCTSTVQQSWRRQRLGLIIIIARQTHTEERRHKSSAEQ